MSKVFKIQFITIFSFLLLSTNCWGILLLENSEIVDIHNEMSKKIQKAYTKMPFGASDKFNNLCTASVQFVYKKNETIKITTSKPLKNKNGKRIITTSTYIEKLYDDGKKNPYEALSWPFFNENKFRHIKNTKEDTKIYTNLFSETEDNSKCAQALDLTLEEYDQIQINQANDLNPIYYLKTKYGYTTLNNIKHAEALLVWWIEIHFKEIVSQGLNDIIEMESENSMIVEGEGDVEPEILYAIIHYYTKRQTCVDCERLIQKSANEYGYVPILSFSEHYPSDSLVEGSKVCEVHGNKKCIVPFSQLKKDFLTSKWSKRLRNISNPINFENYLQQRYPINTDTLFANFEQNEGVIKNLFYYKKYTDMLAGIERFPIQFYAPS